MLRIFTEIVFLCNGETVKSLRYFIMQAQFNLVSKKKVIFRAWDFGTEWTSAKPNLLPLHTLKEQLKT
jgi:hypothetical protein